MNKLQSVPSRVGVADTVGTHQLTDADSGSSSSTLSLSARGVDVSHVCNSGGVALMALSMWQRLLVGLESLVGLQSASHRSYNIVN